MKSHALVAFPLKPQPRGSDVDRGGREGTSAASDFTVHLCSSGARNRWRLSGGRTSALRQPEFLSIVIVIPLRQPSNPQKEKESSSQRAADVTLWRNLPASSSASDGW